MPTPRDVSAIRRRVSRLLRTYATRFSRLSRIVRRRVEDDPVHDLRVLTRRIRSAIWVARHLAPSCDFRLLRSALSRVGRVLGRRRLLDVARADAAEFGLDGSRLDRRRAREGAALAQELNEVNRAAMGAGLRQVARILPRATEERLAGALESHRRRLMTTATRARRGPAQLHDLRIEAKKTRYLLEALARKGDFLRELQRRIGRAHDLEILQQLFKRHEAASRQEARARAAAYRILDRVVGRAVRELTAVISALRGVPAPARSPDGSVPLARSHRPAPEGGGGPARSP